jgi:opacity protein-like surface antigen
MKSLVIIANVLSVYMLSFLGSCFGGGSSGGSSGEDPCKWVEVNNMEFLSVTLTPPNTRVVDSKNIDLWDIWGFNMLFNYDHRTMTKIIVSVSVTDCDTLKKEKTYSKSTNYNLIYPTSLSQVPQTGKLSESHTATLTIISGPFYDAGGYPGYVVWDKKFDTNTFTSNENLNIKGQFKRGEYGVSGIVNPKQIPRLYRDGNFQTLIQ